MILRVLLTLLVIPSILVAQSDTSTKHVPRFFKVADGLYRGGQPEERGFEFLKAQGIKTVVNLRVENGEEQIVRKLGMNYVHIPMSIGFGSKISDANIARYFEVLGDPQNLPIFLHCRRGADRTGAMVSFYRIIQEGWDGQKAYDEARKVGMRWWYRGLKKQIEAFAPRRMPGNAKKI